LPASAGLDSANRSADCNTNHKSWTSRRQADGQSADGGQPEPAACSDPQCSGSWKRPGDRAPGESKWHSGSVYTRTTSARGTDFSPGMGGENSQSAHL